MRYGKPTKNKRRIDPRYFLEETTIREQDEDEGQQYKNMGIDMDPISSVFKDYGFGDQPEKEDTFYRVGDPKPEKVKLPYIYGKDPIPEKVKLPGRLNLSRFLRSLASNSPVEDGMINFPYIPADHPDKERRTIKYPNFFPTSLGDPGFEVKPDNVADKLTPSNPVPKLKAEKDKEKYGGSVKRTKSGRPIIPKGSYDLVKKGRKNPKFKETEEYKNALASIKARRAWNKDNKGYYSKKKKTSVKKPKVSFKRQPAKRKLTPAQRADAEFQKGQGAVRVARSPQLRRPIPDGPLTIPKE